MPAARLTPVNGPEHTQVARVDAPYVWQPQDFFEGLRRGSIRAEHTCDVHTLSRGLVMAAMHHRWGAARHGAAVDAAQAGQSCCSGFGMCGRTAGYGTYQVTLLANVDPGKGRTDGVLDGAAGGPHLGRGCATARAAFNSSCWAAPLDPTLALDEAIWISVIEYSLYDRPRT